MDKVKVKQEKGTTAGGRGTLGGGKKRKAPPSLPSQPLQLLQGDFKYACMVEEDHKMPIFGCKFNHLLKLGEPQILATVGSNRVSIYECLPEGGLKLLRVIADPDTKEVFYCCAWGEDEEGRPLLAAAGFRGIVRILAPSFPTANPKACQGHGSAVNDLLFHPEDKNLLFSASKDHTLRLWNIKKDPCICIAIFGGVEGHRDEVLSVDIHLNCSRIVTSGMDHSLKVWDLKKPEIECNIRLSTGYDSQSSRTPFPTFRQNFPDFSTRDLHGSYVDCAKWNGDFVLSKSVQNQIVCWKPGKAWQKWGELEMGASSTTFIYELEIKDCKLWFNRFSLDFWQKKLALGNTKGKIYVYDLSSTDLETLVGTKPTILTHPGCTEPIRQTTWSRDGKVLICVCEDATIWRWDIQTQETNEVAKIET